MRFTKNGASKIKHKKHAIPTGLIIAHISSAGPFPIGTVRFIVINCNGGSS